MRHSNEMGFLGSTLSLLLLTGQGVAPAPRVAVAGDAGGVLICHHAGPTKTIEISVSPAAVPAHVFNHGDTVGPCVVPT
jgi:hypothetical protein